jgi:chaperonin GroEL
LEAFFRQSGDEQERTWTRERLQSFHGVGATLWVGGEVEAAASERLTRAKRAVRVLRSTLGNGAVPGGGSALLACRVPLRERLSEAENEAERAALRIVIKALEVPFRTILANAGYDAAGPLHRIESGPVGLGFDAVRGEIVDVRAAGIVDSLAVTAAAATGSIRSAALALTIDAVVHTRSTEISVDPE